jgi:hypothetical protein
VNNEEKQVRPTGWKPWANTVLYLPLKENIQEKSWNSIWDTYILSASGTITFDSSVANIPVAYFNWSSWIQTSPSYTTAYSTNTLSCWVRYNSYSNMPAILRRWSVNLYVQNTWITYEIFSSWWHAYAYQNSSYLSTNTRQLLTLTSDGNKSYCYLNWVQIWTINYAPTQSDGGRNRPCIWNNVWDSNNRKLTWYISNVIWESKCWTADEVLAYYNQTKANYWL